MAYLPFWLAATVRRFSAHRFRFLGITFENLLLLGGIGALLASFSRVGWLAFLLMAAYLLIQANLWVARRLQNVVFKTRPEQPAPKLRDGLLRSAFWLGILLVFVCVYLAGILGLAYGAGKIDRRFARIFERPDPTQVTTLLEYANHLAFAERLVFWATGWEVFNDHPFLGVGLGNVGFYFPHKMPGYGYGLTEVNDLFYRWSYMPNTKSLWSRIVAETGLAGLAFFLAWLYLLWQAARLLRTGSQPLYQSLGLAGNLALMALLAEGFSIDSFALPYLWVSFGLLTAASEVYRLELTGKE